jgi:hypothetical protein
MAKKVTPPKKAKMMYTLPKYATKKDMIRRAKREMKRSFTAEGFKEFWGK